MPRLLWDRLPCGRAFLHGLLIAAAAVGVLIMIPTTWAESGTPTPPEASDGAAHAPVESTNDTNTTVGIPSELRKLSIEQLLEVEITPINVLGSHTHLKG